MITDPCLKVKYKIREVIEITIIILINYELIFQSFYYQKIHKWIIIFDKEKVSTMYTTKRESYILNRA